MISGSKLSGMLSIYPLYQVSAALNNLIQHVFVCCHFQAETFWWPTQHIAKPFFQLRKFQQTISHYSNHKDNFNRKATTNTLSLLTGITLSLIYFRDF